MNLDPMLYKHLKKKQKKWVSESKLDLFSRQNNNHYENESISFTHDRKQHFQVHRGPFFWPAKTYFFLKFSLTCTMTRACAYAIVQPAVIACLTNLLPAEITEKNIKTLIQSMFECAHSQMIFQGCSEIPQYPSLQFSNRAGVSVLIPLSYILVCLYH